MTPDLKQELHVKVISPFEIIYEGKARSLSARNAVGTFDILPGHVNFMTLLEAGDVVVLTSVDERRYALDHGILKVNRNTVVVFANI